MIYKKLNSFIIGSIMTFVALVPMNVDSADVNEMESNVTYYNNSSDNYFINIPKTIEMNEDMIGTYEVSVTGSIESYEEIRITPVDSIEETEEIDFYMVSTNNEKVNTIITQDKTSWISDDINNNVVASGTVSAQDLTAGKWEGTFYFEFDTIELSTSIENIEIGIGDTTNFTIFYDGNDVTNEVAYFYDNNYINIQNGTLAVLNNATSGITKIKAQYKNLSKIITVNIIDIVFKQNGVEVNSVIVNQGDTVYLEANISPSVIDGVVTWKYGNLNTNVNENKISINTALLNGHYELNASYLNINKTLNVVVNEKDDTTSNNTNFEFTPEGILNAMKTAFEEAGLTYSLDYATSEEINMFGPTLGMGWGLWPIGNDVTYETMVNEGKTLLKMGYKMFYLEYVETKNDGTIVIKGYRG